MSHAKGGVRARPTRLPPNRRAASRRCHPSYLAYRFPKQAWGTRMKQGDAEEPVFSKSGGHGLPHASFHGRDVNFG